MHRNSYDNDDFEMFLKQKSDQYKMYPSDKVWSNIHTSLHGRKKWWALGFTLFFISAGLLGGKQLLLSHYSRMATELNANTETLAFAKDEKHISTTRSIAKSLPSISKNTSGNSAKANTIAEAPVEPIIPQSNNSIGNTWLSIVKPDSKSINELQSANDMEETSLVIENDLLPSLPTAIAGNKGRGTSISTSFIKIALRGKASTKAHSAEEGTASLINQVENAAATLVKPSRWSLQFYASPTISYRRLSTVNQDINSVPVATSYATNINQYVNHKPATGFELGSNVQYDVSDNLRLFAGAQINYSRYYISAYKYRTEKASIVLSSPAAHDTLSGYTDIRNFSGYAPEQLQNKYVQLSIPVGIEIKLLGNKKLQFSVAGGIQPTFLLNSTSYLISTDYKNYIQSPDLARSFNVHTNFEAVVSYKAAGLRWQIGPQFRSQLLSSYSNQYRVREYLTEYGIKFGVSKSF